MNNIPLWSLCGLCGAQRSFFFNISLLLLFLFMLRSVEHALEKRIKSGEALLPSQFLTLISLQIPLLLEYSFQLRSYLFCLCWLFFH